MLQKQQILFKTYNFSNFEVVLISEPLHIFKKSIEAIFYESQHLK